MAVCNMVNAAPGTAKRPRLNDGRWTLAFEDAASAKKAEQMVDRQRNQLRQNADQLFRNFNV